MTAADRAARERVVSLRIALAWRELRRGAAGLELRNHVLGPSSPALEQAQLDALEIVVAQRDGWRMSDFADALRVDPSSATRAIDRHETLGLAERVRATDDKRVVLVRATTEGRRVMRTVGRSRASGMERLLEPFELTEREQFAEYLERFVDSIDRLVDELRRQS
ncbi:MAG: MarR family winged helix-turn-helix transcriptional regulator [Acidimicrobiia bacterium]